MDDKLTKGQVEDIISKEVTKFYSQTLGTGPEGSRVYILKDMVIVRLKGKLLPIETKLLEDKNGVDLVKNIRQTLHEILTKKLGAIVSKVTKHQVISSHSDISTKTGEHLEVFILDANLEDELNKQSNLR